MIKLNVKGHNDICAGYCYSGTASFSGRTVKEILDEIREYSKDKHAKYLGDGFGNPNIEWGAWSISINGKTYWNCWLNKETHQYTHDLDNLLVDKIEVDGGWYCFYDFYISTK